MVYVYGESEVVCADATASDATDGIAAKRKVMPTRWRWCGSIETGGGGAVDGFSARDGGLQVEGWSLS